MSEIAQRAWTAEGQVRIPHSAFRIDRHWPLLLLFAFIVCAPLTYPGYVQTHSGFLPVYNLYDLEAGGWDLRWAPVVGRDFDLLRGEGPLPYLLAEAPRWLGAGGVTVVKIVFGLGLSLGALGMYGWTRQQLGRRGALLAALVYLCWPYALATVYVRGALAEALFFGLFPWTLWALRRGVALAIGVALLVWTQPGLALWAALALLVYGLAVKNGGQETASEQGRHWVLTVAAVLGGLLLGAAGLWPLAATRGLGGTDVAFSKHFVYPFQLLSPAWGHGVSGPGWQDDFPLQLGLMAVGLATVAVVLLSRSAAPRGAYGRAPLQGSLGLCLVLTFLSLTWAAPLWRLPGLSQASRTLTYPWQLLALVGPFLALLAGSAVTLGLEHESEDTAGLRPYTAALIALILLSSYGYLEPRTTRYEPGAAPLAVLGDNDLLLLDAQVEGSLQPGRTVRLRVHWQPLRPLAKDYTIFVHAVDETGQRWGQQDTQPQSGTYPTSQWQVGEVIEDRYELRIAADGPPTGYHLDLGLYDLQTGERMRVGKDNRVVIGRTP
ncbi:MAG: hypothetical protein QHJ81_08210 [Anaerolineae bacterium]|nr:hypothetical protein [Anaerolineae bacterium]